MAEGHALRDAIHIGFVNRARATQVSAAFRPLGLQQMAFAGARAHHFAARGDLKPLRCRFLGLNAFWTSHIKVSRFASKKSGEYRCLSNDKQVVFWSYSV